MIVRLQCCEIVRDKSFINNVRIREIRRKQLMNYRYFTPFRKLVEAESSKIDNRESLSKFILQNYGQGEFGIFFKRYIEFKKNPFKIYPPGWKRRGYRQSQCARIVVKKGLGDDVIYDWNDDYDKMKELDWWRDNNKKKHSDVNINAEREMLSEGKVFEL